MLFELGARLYPSRDLYLAYLRQSDIFGRVNDERQIAEHWGVVDTLGTMGQLGLLCSREH